MVQSEKGKKLGLDPSPYCRLDSVDARILRWMRMNGVTGSGESEETTDEKEKEG